MGTQPLQLKKFGKGPNRNVFVCSDRPAVIYSSNQKLVFSNVNLKTVTCMSPLDTEAYPNCMILSDGDSLVIGWFISFFLESMKVLMKNHKRSKLSFVVN